MVSIVWFILYLCKVCSFSWIPVLIEGVVGLIITIVISEKQEEDRRYSFGRHKEDTFASDVKFTLAVLISVGCIFFSFYKLFFSLQISAWWLLLAPIVGALAIALPGGFTGLGLILANNGLCTLPKWGLIVSIVFDVIFLIWLIAIIASFVKEKKK